MKTHILGRTVPSIVYLYVFSVIDALGLDDVKQSVAAVEKVSLALKTLSDVYVVSTFRLPPKLGGVLLGLYNKQDNKKYLEMAIMSKINKGNSVLKHIGKLNLLGLSKRSVLSQFWSGTSVKMENCTQ